MEGGLRSLAIKVFKIRDWFLDALFPKTCFRCDKERTWFCEECTAMYKPFSGLMSCLFCHEESLLGRTCGRCRKQTFLDGYFSMGHYGDPVLRRAIHVWKYYEQKEVQEVLMKWLCASRLIPQISSLNTAQDKWCVQAIPLHIKRYRERGFNQAEVIAQTICTQSGLPYKDMLARQVFTPSQAKRAHEQRKVGELDGIFSLRFPFENETSVFLCDDVITSGTTMDAAAKVLKEAGAKTVWGIVLAKG